MSDVKAKVRTARVFLPPDARDSLDTYLNEIRGDQVGSALHYRQW